MEPMGVKPESQMEPMGPPTSPVKTTEGVDLADLPSDVTCLERTEHACTCVSLFPHMTISSNPISKLPPQDPTSFLQAELELQFAALHGAMEESPLGDDPFGLEAETDPYGFFSPERVEADQADQPLHTTRYMSMYVTDCYIGYMWLLPAFNILIRIRINFI